MRYSAVQEDGYGVGLRQDIQPNNNNNNISNNNVDDSMMAATGEVEPVGEGTADECSMVYNLPLLFANGYPTSLEKITLPQLEKFITFMTRCSLGNNTTQVLNKPAWWPTEVEFSIPLVRPKKSGDSWMRCLRRVVLQCYSFHQSEYLLRFCTYLAQYPQAKLYYVNNWDSTTSLYHKSTGKLLATFRNENMDYDKVIEPHRKSLLPINNANSNSQTKHKKTQQRNHRQSPSSLVRIQPQMEEIYLCDNCDAEFLDLKQMKDHEKSCGETVKTVHQETSSCWRPITPEVEAEPELTQNQFMEYFNLSTPNQQPSKITTTDPSSIPAISIETEPSRSSRRMKPSANLCRSSTIPFSSPAGLALVKKSKGMNEATKRDRVDRIEWHLSAPALTKTNRPKWFGKFSSSGRWVVTYKPNISKENPPTDDYVHQYTFGAVRRKPSLDVRSQILYIACGSSFVKLNRLTDEQFQDLKEHPWKYQPPIRKIRHRIRPRLIMRISGKSTGQKRQYSSRLTEVMPIIEQEPEINQVKTGSLKRGYTPNFRSRPSVVPISKIPSSTPTIEEPLQKTIVIVDLCSSDEEDIPSNHMILSDENRDPLNSTFENVRMNNSFSKNLGLQPMNDRLRDSILTDDNDKSCNKRLSNGVIDAFSPILKPTP